MKRFLTSSSWAKMTVMLLWRVTVNRSVCLSCPHMVARSWRATPISYWNWMCSREGWWWLAAQRWVCLLCQICVIMFKLSEIETSFTHQKIISERQHFPWTSFFLGSIVWWVSKSWEHLCVIYRVHDTQGSHVFNCQTELNPKVISEFGNSDYDALCHGGYHAQTQQGYPPWPLTQFWIIELAYLPDPVQR